jgi:hypothetical protein
VKAGSVRLPRAVAFSSSSSEDSASYCWDGDIRVGGIISFEELRTRSSSLSLSSYSSWLLVLVCLAARPICEGAWTRRRLRVLESCATRRPVVTISSPIEESEEEEGWEDISTQDSDRLALGEGWRSMSVPSLRNR